MVTLNKLLNLKGDKIKFMRLKNYDNYVVYLRPLDEDNLTLEIMGCFPYTNSYLEEKDFMKVLKKDLKHGFDSYNLVISSSIFTRTYERRLKGLEYSVLIEHCDVYVSITPKCDKMCTECFSCAPATYFINTDNLLGDLMSLPLDHGKDCFREEAYKAKFTNSLVRIN